MRNVKLSVPEFGFSLESTWN